MDYKVKILCFGDSLESITIRNVLESFNIKVELCYIGRPNDFIKEINDNSGFEYIILSGHGTNEKFIVPELVESVYEKNEPRNITSDIIKEKFNITNKIIISTACATGSEELAKPFTNKCITYIAPTDYIDGKAALFFVIRFFYEHLTLNKSIDEAFDVAMQTDNETRLYKLFK